MDLEIPNVVLQMLNVWMGALPTRSWRNFETFAILTGNSWKYWHTELAVEFSTKFWFIDEMRCYIYGTFKWER